MKKINIALLLMVCSVFSMNLSAQCDSPVNVAVEDTSLENWEVISGETATGTPYSYENIAGDYWSTANGVVQLSPGFIAPNVEKTTDAHSGSYAAKLVTASWFGTIGSGSLYTGDFNADLVGLGNPADAAVFGKPYNEDFLPTHFSFWYKFEQVEGDSAKAYAYLSKGTGDDEVIIARASTLIENSVSEYTEMVLEFDYYTEDEPEYISIVFASSAAGEFFVGQVGNTLYVDDVSVYSCVTNSHMPLMSEHKVDVFPNPATDMLNVSFEAPVDNATLRIYTNDGKLMHEKEISGDAYSLNVEDWNGGLYRYQVQDSGNFVTLAGGSFTIRR